MYTYSVYGSYKLSLTSKFISIYIVSFFFRPSQEENTAYNLEIHRGSVDYDVINDEAVEQVKIQ